MGSCEFVQMFIVFKQYYVYPDFFQSYTFYLYMALNYVTYNTKPACFLLIPGLVFI